MKLLETNHQSVTKKELVLEKSDLPLTILYKGTRYILLLTKNDKMLLNK
jgi:hypothetical protein